MIYSLTLRRIKLAELIHPNPFQQTFSLSDRALEIMEEALFYGTITFEDKTTRLKPETVLNLAKSLSAKRTEPKSTEVDAPIDFFPSSSESSELDKSTDPNQLDFPFLSHEGK